MTTGLWVLFWVLVSLVIIGILLWAANRKPVEAAREPADDVCAQMRRQMPYRPDLSPLNYLADIYPQTGEYPKPLTGIQKAAEDGIFDLKPKFSTPPPIPASDVASLRGNQKRDEKESGADPTFMAGSTAVAEVNVERLQKAYSEAKGSWFPAPPSNIVFREPKFEMAGFKPLAESAKTRRPSVKSKTPVVKKKAPAKKAKPVAKKATKKKV